MVTAGTQEKLQNAVFLNRDDYLNKDKDETDVEDLEGFNLDTLGLEQMFVEAMDTSPKQHS